MFQVPEMAYDPVTRTAALMSLVCALMSLAFGCLFIIRFGTMRSMNRASNWAEVSYMKANVLVAKFHNRRRKSPGRQSYGTYGSCWRPPLYGWPGR